MHCDGDMPPGERPMTKAHTHHELGQVSTSRKFRFGVQLNWAASAEEFCARARRAEDLGYATFTVADHLDRQYACLPAVLAAGLATQSIRVGPHVLANDYKHPVVLAKELATADVLLGGRVQVGIGAGWLRDDYLRSGIPFDPAGTRIARLEESLTVLKGLWSGSSFSFHGDHYQIDMMEGFPTPAQKPHPPIMIGAGGKRMLGLAARHADIINISVNQGAGVRDVAAVMSGDVNQAAGINQQRIEWIRDAAGERFDEIELGAMCFVVPTEDRHAVVRERAQMFGIAERDLLDSPQWLIGSPAEMVDDLLRRRDELGISYVIFFDDMAERMAPIVEELAGK